MQVFTPSPDLFRRKAAWISPSKESIQTRTSQNVLPMIILTNRVGLIFTLTYSVMTHGCGKTRFCSLMIRKKKEDANDWRRRVSFRVSGRVQSVLSYLIQYQLPAPRHTSYVKTASLHSYQGVGVRRAYASKKINDSSLTVKAESQSRFALSPFDWASLPCHLISSGGQVPVGIFTETQHGCEGANPSMNVRPHDDRSRCTLFQLFTGKRSLSVPETAPDVRKDPSPSLDLSSGATLTRAEMNGSVPRLLMAVIS